MSLRHAGIAGLLLLLVASLAGGGYALGLRAAPRPQLPGPVDIGFTQAMRGHHDQAVVMSQIMLADGGSEIAGLARAIESAQLMEIGQMKGWLLLWDKPLLPATSSMDWMLLGRTPPDAALSRYLIDCRNSPGGMPGLATQEQLARLRSLKGRERDLWFLQLMIRHHQGGLPMARFAAQNAETPAVRMLAAQIESEQTQEAATMLLLAQRLAGQGAAAAR